MKLLRLFLTILFVFFCSLPNSAYSQDDLCKKYQTTNQGIAISTSHSPSITDVKGASVSNSLPDEIEKALLANEYKEGSRKSIIVFANIHEVKNEKGDFVPQGVFATNDSFDGNKISQYFEKNFDYRPLKIFNGNEARQSEILESIRTAEINEEDTLLIYIIAHGGGYESNNFYLKLYNAEITLEQIIDARKKQDAPSIGKTLIILDSCYSGKIVDNKLSTRDLSNITIITASSKTGKAKFMKDGSSTALSHFINQAFTSEWDMADEKKEGFITPIKLVEYLRPRLACAEKNNELLIENPSEMEKMKPEIFGLTQEMIIAFRKDKVKEKSNRILEILLAYIPSASQRLLYSIGLGNRFLIENPKYYTRYVDVDGSNCMKAAPCAMIEVKMGKIYKPLEDYNSLEILSKDFYVKQELWDKDSDALLQKNIAKVASNIIVDEKIDNEQMLYARAVKELGLGNYLNASNLYSELIAKFPKSNERYYLELSLAYRLDKKRPEEVLHVFDNGLKEFPQSFKIMIEKASTMVFADGDAKSGNSVKTIEQAIILENRLKGKLSKETIKSLNNFQLQLTYLTRSGDVLKINEIKKSQNLAEGLIIIPNNIPNNKDLIFKLEGKVQLKKTPN